VKSAGWLKPWEHSPDGYHHAVVESQVTALELEKVIPKIQRLFERDDKFYATISKRDVTVVSNRQMRVPLQMHSGGAFQYFDPDGGDLGRGGGPAWDKAVVSPVFCSENIEYTKLTQWSTNNDRKSIANAVKKLTAEALDELRKQLDSQLKQPGTGVVGTIGVVATAAGVDTYTLNVDGFGAKLIRHGQTLQVFDATLATNRGKGVVTYFDIQNNIIHVEPAIAGAIATDLLVVDGITTPTAIPAILGLPYHHNNSSVGTWLGFPRSTTPEIRANRVNAAGAPLSLPLPRLAINQIGNRLGMDNGFKPKAWMHPCQKQAYEDIGQSVSFIQKSTKEEGLNMYFDRMQFAGAADQPDYAWDKTRIDFVLSSVWGRAEILPLGFYTTDGRKIFEIRSSSGGLTTADIFYMVWGGQFFVNNPAACSYIDNLAIPAGYQ
jgi:hypothetical protein